MYIFHSTNTIKTFIMCWYMHKYICMYTYNAMYYMYDIHICVYIMYCIYSPCIYVYVIYLRDIKICVCMCVCIPKTTKNDFQLLRLSAHQRFFCVDKLMHFFLYFKYFFFLSNLPSFISIFANHTWYNRHHCFLTNFLMMPLLFILSVILKYFS